MSWLIAGIIAGALALLQAFRTGKQYGVNSQAKKDADSYEKHINDIANANTARGHVTDSLPDKDKYRRD